MIEELVYKDLYKNLTFKNKSLGIKNSVDNYGCTIEKIINNSEPYQFFQEDFRYIRIYNIELKEGFCLIWDKILNKYYLMNLLVIYDEDMMDYPILKPKILNKNPNKYQIYRLMQMINELNINNNLIKFLYND